MNQGLSAAQILRSAIPERINPGDEAHNLDKITKIVSGMDRETTSILSSLYGLITTVYEAKDIKIRKV